VSTLLDLLAQRAKETPNQTAYLFLKDEETIIERLTYQDLADKALTIAAGLQQLGATGDRVLLLYPPGLEFIEALFGCFAAGMIAVPAYPPRPNQSLKRLQSIVKSSQAKLSLSSTKIQSNQDNKNYLGDLTEIDCRQLTQFNSQDWKPLKLTPDTLGILQYTSGSTGNPKGVMVSHGNLISNCEDLSRGWHQEPNSKLVSWLPTFHDLGLVYGILTPLWRGFPSYLLSPLSFLLKPITWLKIISRYQATHSAAPNFAYDLCVRKFKPKDGENLDLTSWRMTLNGAQPVKAETLASFSQTFALYGFKPQTFSPGYGLAEATLKVAAVRDKDDPLLLIIEKKDFQKNQVKVVKQSTLSLFNAENPLLNNYQNQEVFLKKAIPISQEKPINMLLNKELKTQILVSCGQSEIDTEIQIINPETLMPSQANEIGEIWVRGLTVSQGYWNNPSASELTFQAYRSDTKEGPFLRTGDLGFLYQGQLFVTGRLKDLIIIEGRNHYPQDIESTVENTDLALRKEACAAFSVEIKGEERLVIVAEIERSYDRKIDEVALKKKIREAVALEHDIRGDKIALIRHNCLPKTSSGKIQRQLCRSLFLNGELELLTSEPENLNSLTLSQNKTLQEIC